MSILKSTHSGYKYYRWKDILQNCCEFKINGEPTNCYATVNDDGSVNIDASEEPTKMKMYTKLAQRGQQMPDEWFIDQPFKMLSYIAHPYETYNAELIIKKPFDQNLRFSRLSVNVRIECELPYIEQNFYHTRIDGIVEVDKSLLEIYPSKYLYAHRICTYYGKELMGF